MILKPSSSFQKSGKKRRTIRTDTWDSLQEAYFKRKQCTFTDPPPGTKDADDDNDDESISPTTYAPGWCGIHVTQYQKNEPGNSATSNSPDYILSVCVFDANKVLLNQYPGGEAGDCGEFVAPNGARQPVCQVDTRSTRRANDVGSTLTLIADRLIPRYPAYYMSPLAPSTAMRYSSTIKTRLGAATINLIIPTSGLTIMEAEMAIQASIAELRSTDDSRTLLVSGHCGIKDSS